MTEKIRKMTQSELSDIDKLNGLECDKLRRGIILNKKLFYLYHLEKTKDIRQETI